MGAMQLAVAVFGFAKELFKYLREHEENNKACAVKITEVKHAIKDSRKSKNTANLEAQFGALGLSKFPTADK